MAGNGVGRGGGGIYDSDKSARGDRSAMHSTEKSAEADTAGWKVNPKEVQSCLRFDR
jgi:hypothetical protein